MKNYFVIGARRHSRKRGLSRQVYTLLRRVLGIVISGAIVTFPLASFSPVNAATSSFCLAPRMSLRSAEVYRPFSFSLRQTGSESEEEFSTRQRRQMDELLALAGTTSRRWPVARVAAGMRSPAKEEWEATATNSLGAHRHAEINLVLDVLRRELEEGTPRQVYMPLLRRLEALSYETKLNHSDEALSILRELSRLAKDPFRDAIIYTTLRPCAACIRVVSELGGRAIYFKSEHPDRRFVSASDRMARESRNHRIQVQQVAPGLESIRDPNEVFFALREHPEYERVAQTIHSWFAETIGHGSPREASAGIRAKKRDAFQRMIGHLLGRVDLRSDMRRIYDSIILARRLMDNQPVGEDEFSLRVRRETMDRIRSAGEVVDLFVLGAGIAGASVTRDAALNGLSVMMVDKGDMAGGTSSGSTKLIHAGIKYLMLAWESLKKGDLRSAGDHFNLVREATRERGTLQRIAPHLVKPVPISMVISKHDRRSLFAVVCGVYLYYALSVFSGQIFPPPKVYTSSRAIRRYAPAMNSGDIKGIIVLWDSMTDDARLVMETARSAYRSGARVVTYAEVRGYKKNEHGLFEIRIKDRLDGEEYVVQARQFINAAGPWIDRVRQRGGRDDATIDLVSGIHLDVYPKITDKNVLFTAGDGRLIFVINRNEDGLEFSRIGTTDTKREDPDDFGPKSQEVEYLVRETINAFPRARINTDTIMRVDSAIRPLARGEAGLSAFEQSRRHFLHTDRDGLISMTSKITDARNAAREAVDLVWQSLRPGERRICRTCQEPLRSAGPDRIAYRELTPITSAYHEMIIRLEDWFFRRQGLLPFAEYKKDARYLTTVARQIGTVLGWDEERIQHEIEACRQKLRAMSDVLEATAARKVTPGIDPTPAVTFRVPLYSPEMTARGQAAGVSRSAVTAIHLSL